MKNISCFFLFLILSFTCITVHAQDIHFSQYDENPSLINPALTGSGYAMRAAAIYRDQWRSATVPYKTYGASFEMRLKTGNWKKVENNLKLTEVYKKAFRKLAGGLSFYSDKAGDGNMGITQANLSLATFIPLNKKSFLSAGLQASVVQRKIDFTKLVWPDQYNGTGYDQSMDPGENFSSSFIYPDFAGGLAWTYGSSEKYISANDQFRADVGVAMFHFGEPKQKFLAATNERLFSKYVVHAKFLLGVKNTNLSIAPSCLFQFQGPSKEILYGTLLKYRMREDSKYTGYKKGACISLGAFYRNKDAMITALLFEFGQYAIGASYDINVSKFKAATTARGGFEICLRFNSPSPFLFQTKSRI